jgi:hypothetical protein
MLRAAPYFHAVLGWPGEGWRWGTFRQLWWELRMQQSPVDSGGLWFNKGLGLTAAGMVRYLECMFAGQGASASQAANLIAFGIAPAAGGGAPQISIGSFSSLMAAFNAMHGLRRN